MAACLAAANLQGYECLGATPPARELNHPPHVELLRRFLIIRQHDGLKDASHCGGVPHRPDLNWVGWKDTPHISDAGNAAYSAIVRAAIGNLTREESVYLDGQQSWYFWDVKRLNDNNLADLAEAMLATNNYAYTVQSNTVFSWAELRGGSYPDGDRVTYWFLTLLVQAATPCWTRQPQDRTVSFLSRGHGEPHPEPLATTTSATANTTQAAVLQAGTVDPWSGGDDPWSRARSSLTTDHGVVLSGSAPEWPPWDEAPTAPGHVVGA